MKLFKKYEYYVVTVHGAFGGIEAGPYPTQEAAQTAIDEKTLPDIVQAVAHIAGLAIRKVEK